MAKSISKVNRLKRLVPECESLLPILTKSAHSLAVQIGGTVILGINQPTKQRMAVAYLLQQHKVAPRVNIFVPAGRAPDHQSEDVIQFTFNNFMPEAEKMSGVNELHFWAEHKVHLATRFKACFRGIIILIDFHSYMNREGNSHAFYIRGTPITERDLNETLAEFQHLRTASIDAAEQPKESS